MRLSGNGRSGSTRGSGAGSVRRCTGWGASPAAIPTCSSCGGRACGRRLECRSRMRRESHVRFWEGGGVQVPSATRPLVHCGSEAEARSVLEAIRGRLADCGLELHPTKTRIVYCKDDDRPGSTNTSRSTSSATPSNRDGRRTGGGDTSSASCRRSAPRPRRRSGRPSATGGWRPPGTTSAWRIWLALRTRWCGAG